MGIETLKTLLNTMAQANPKSKDDFDEFMEIMTSAAQDDLEKMELERWLQSNESDGQSIALRLINEIESGAWEEYDEMDEESCEWKIEQRLKAFYDQLQTIDLDAFLIAYASKDNIDTPLNDQGITRLSYAIETQYKKLIDVLIAKQANPFTKYDKYFKHLQCHQEGVTAIMEAALFHDLDFFRYFVDRIELTPSQAYVSIVKTPLDKVDQVLEGRQNESLSDFAKRYILDAMLKTNIDLSSFADIVNATSKTTFYESDIDILIEVIQKNQLDNSALSELLILAARQGNQYKVDQLIELGADPNYRNVYDQTAFIAALEMGKTEVAYNLGLKMKDINQGFITHRTIVGPAQGTLQAPKTKQVKSSPLLYALNTKNEILAKLLIERGANVNEFSTLGSPLALACQKGLDVSVIAILVDRGADINQPNGDGNTPLHLALMNNHVKIAHYLKEQGANLHIKNLSGKYPFQMQSIEDKAFIDNEPTPQQLSQAKAYESKVKNAMVADAYDKTLEDVSSMIILGLESGSETLESKTSFTTIANNQGYPGSWSQLGDDAIKGYPCSVEMNGIAYPVGYNIHIPKHVTSVDKVCVSAYGGKNVGDKGFRPSQLTLIGHELVQNGIIYVTLNLPDLLLLKSSQRDMEESLHHLIHQSIDHFFHLIHDSPEKLHPSLANILTSHPQIYLQGGSFGGRTAVRHSQLYPNTFAGYISHDGALAERKDLPAKERRPYKHSQLLLPEWHIQNMVDPVLILQNRDDNNVILDAAVKFYEKCVEADKHHLVRVAFFEKGNPAPKKLRNKGHFAPEGQERKRYLETIRAFMESGVSQIPELHAYRALRNKHFIEQFFYNSDERERFLSMADVVLSNNKRHALELQQHLRGSPNGWSETWEMHYQPLIRAMAEARALASNNTYYKTYLDYLSSHDLLSDDVVQDAIQRHAPALCELYNELHEGSKITTSEMIENPLVQQSYKQRLTQLHQNESAEYKQYIIEQLLLTHPELCPPIEMSQAWTQESLDEVEKTFRQSFESHHQHRSKALKKTWINLRQSIMDQVKSQLDKVQQLSRQMYESPPTNINQLVEYMLKIDKLQTNYPSVQAKIDELYELLAEQAQVLDVDEKDTQFHRCIIERLKDPLTKENTYQFLRREVNLILSISDTTLQEALKANLVMVFVRLFPDLSEQNAYEYIKRLELSRDPKQTDAGLDSLELALYHQMPIELIKTLVQESTISDKSMFFAIDNPSEVIACLIKHGGNIEAKDEHGHSLLTVAQSKEKHSLIPIIQDALAQKNYRIEPNGK